MILKEVLSYYSLLALFFALTLNGNAQSYNELSNEKKLKICSQSYVLISIDENNIHLLDSITNISAPLAFEIRTRKGIELKEIKAFIKNEKEALIITNQNIDSLLVQDLSVIRIDPKEIETLILNVDAINDTLKIVDEIKKITKISFKHTNKDKKKSLLNLWMQSGKQPNFIEANSASIFEIDSVVSSLNALKKVFGVVKTKRGQLIDAARFKGYGQSSVNGHFSFPIIEGEEEEGEEEILPILIPYKAGYHFSPDIIYTTPVNIKNSKDFIAFQLDLEFGLSNHFVFKPNFKNKIKNNDKALLRNNVEIKTDPIHGKIGYFNNRGYIDAGIESKNSLQESFTIAAWIKPTSLGFNNSILGKGDNFVLKLHHGFLTFTMAGIKDYVSEVSPISLNKWTHIVLAHSKIDNKLFFYVDGKLTEEVKLISDYVTSDYNILIGSNIWEEFFEGYLTDIKIWERELNENEVAVLFKKNIDKPLTEALMEIVILGILLLIMLTFLWKRRSKNETFLFFKKKKLFKKRQVLIPDHGKNQERVLCFGKLRILNKENIDITDKLSPLLKRIVVIVFLYSHQGNKKGISTNLLTEFLWPGMSPQKAKNTRGTNINNLRIILSSCSEINLVFKNKHWFIELTENCYCDYKIIQDYLEDFSKGNYSIKELETELPKFLKILKGGRLFSNSRESWLDPFIEKFSNQIIEQCLDFAEVLDAEKHNDLLLLLTEVVCIYDDLNEKAHRIKLRVLIQQGKLSLAYKIYDNFVKLYYNIYKESYSISFEEITSKVT